MISSNFSWPTVALLVVLAPTAAGAQTAPSRFSDLPPASNRGPLIAAVDRPAVPASGPATFSAQGNTASGQRDSIADGVMKGVIWGAVVAGAALSVVYLSNNAPHGCNGACLPLIAGAVGVGAGIGAGLDALVSNSASQRRFPTGGRKVGFNWRWRF